MRSIWLLLLLAPLLGSCEKKQAQDDGHIVGNGGDYLENLFTQGKLQAVRVLQRFKATPFTELERDSTFGSREDLKLLYDRSDELIPAIRESKHEWNQKLPQGCPHSTCGCTLPNHPNTVFLSYDNCRETHTLAQAGSVLLHESTHAIMKSDEPTARQLTSVAYELWANWGHPDTPHWAHLKVPGGGNGALVAPFRLGEEVAYLYQKEILRFHPGREGWKKTEIKNHQPPITTDAESWYFSHNQGHVVEGNVVIFAHCWKTRLSAGSGIVIDTVSGQETPLSIENAPSSRYRTVQAKGTTDHHDMLFVWGGDQCEEDFAEGLVSIPTHRDGGIYSPKSGWTPVTEQGAPSFTRTMLAAWNGKEFVLWDGVQSLHRYDPQIKKWLEPLAMPVEVAPENWTMGMTGQGVLILTPKEAIFYRDSKIETHEIGPPIRPIRLGSTATHYGAPSYFGSDFVTFVEKGLIQFDVKTLRWRFLSKPQYSEEAASGLLFSTGWEYVILPSQYSASDGAIFYP